METEEQEYDDEGVSEARWVIEHAGVKLKVAATVETCECYVNVTGTIQCGDVQVGTLEATKLLFSDALESGHSLLNLFDTSGETEECAKLFDDFSEFLKDRYAILLNCPVVDNVALINHIQIYPEHRGHGYGLLTMRCLLNDLADSDSLVVCKPFPLNVGRDGHPVDVRDEDQDIAARKQEQHKLQRYWRRAGFRRMSGTELYALNRENELPTVEEMLKRPARKTTTAKV